MEIRNFYICGHVVCCFLPGLVVYGAVVQGHNSRCNEEGWKSGILPLVPSLFLVAFTSFNLHCRICLVLN